MEHKTSKTFYMKINSTVICFTPYIKIQQHDSWLIFTLGVETSGSSYKTTNEANSKLSAVPSYLV